MKIAYICLENSCYVKSDGFQETKAFLVKLLSGSELVKCELFAFHDKIAPLPGSLSLREISKTLEKVALAPTRPYVSLAINHTFSFAEYDLPQMEKDGEMTVHFIFCMTGLDGYDMQARSYAPGALMALQQLQKAIKNPIEITLIRTPSIFENDPVISNTATETLEYLQRVLNAKLIVQLPVVDNGATLSSETISQLVNNTFYHSLSFSSDSFLDSEILTL